MGNQMIMLDTSILIEFFRKKNKSETRYFQLSKKFDGLFCISSVTVFEIYRGVKGDQKELWDAFFTSITVLHFDKQAALIAAQLDKDLKMIRQQSDWPDLWIAATAVANQIPLATINQKHFEKIESLKIV